MFGGIGFSAQGLLRTQWRQSSHVIILLIIIITHNNDLNNNNSVFSLFLSVTGTRAIKCHALNIE